ncbi:MAG: DUF2330 domain-containing protein [Chloroflexi bacterium]|nr:MAG: DUF2330 domain-containing protein [Chloroflexota bacterium]MBL1196992.1 DUF2330 domain-containing protein [Chloroflexota bacterium]NOH14287.1 DUF2330 domain-containing protein [Chloroflexota bacterium]
MKTHKRLILLCMALMLALPLSLLAVMPAHACGGLFCQNVPVDQNAERIIFSQNRDGTISALIQIQYTGAAPDFSWILPLPAPIGEEDLAVPETAATAFQELELATNPVFIPPPAPECAIVEFEDAIPMAESAAGDVEIFASGEVGPFGFDVIGSEDPTALIRWLRDNEYRVEEPMEPLINVYVEEGFSFLAMRLLPDEDVDSIAPIEVTYPSEAPMIPLRLTAVAANDDMAVLTWFYADRQAVPVNFAHMEIADEELTFFTFGGNNYRTLMGQRADEFGGQAFITEYAAPTRELFVSDPYLADLHERFPYVTRLNTVISPEEMTVDPVFAYDPNAKDVSNIHDLSGMTGLYDCERDAASNDGGIVLPFIGPIFSGDNNNGEEGQTGEPAASGPSLGTGEVLVLGVVVGGLLVGLLVAAIGVGVLLGRRQKS